MRGACVDIGSNTTRLLVAEPDGAGSLRVVCEQRAYTRIGAALHGRDTIPETKREEVIAAVSEQLEVARGHGARAVYGVATAAIRGAANGAALVAELRARTGLEIVVVSGAEEARLAFRGAAGMLAEAVEGPLGVLDVGGGSSEVVVGRAPAAIDWWTSLGLGSGSLAARHLADCDPPHATRLAAARAEVEAALDAVAWSCPAPARVIAVGGSATSLGRVTGPRLHPAALADALAVLASAPAAVIAARYGIAPERARLLPAGLVILERLGQRLGAPVEVGRGGIREGVLLEALT